MRVKYAAATSDTEKAEILAKARRMSPFVEPSLKSDKPNDERHGTRRFVCAHVFLRMFA